MPIRTLHIGLGPIGSGIVAQCASRRGFKIVGGVDIDPAKAGQDLGVVAGLGRTLRVPVSTDIRKTIKATRPDVVVLCTSSALADVMPLIEEVLRRRVALVSTTEELAYPVGKKNKILARRIDQLARKSKVSVLGTGVNPGFVMDALPITLSGACERVDALYIERVQDAGRRRLPFQQKIGAGLTPEEFHTRVAAGIVRHVGFSESIMMIADALGWRLDDVSDVVRPRIAEHRVSSQFVTVEPGRVCGLIQDGVGSFRGTPLITLHMEAYLGAPESYDRVEIDGSPPLRMRIEGGVHGDVATASIAVNSIPKVVAASPGLRTMRDLSLPSWWSGRAGPH
jgi:4-hydroxy-tetrahydrodipicolinate reductase